MEPKDVDILINDMTSISKSQLEFIPKYSKKVSIATILDN